MLGASIWNALDSQTHDYLVLAEELYVALSERRLSDYGSVAVVYRQAIEGEWKARIGSRILELKRDDVRWKIRSLVKLTLGAMISAIQYAHEEKVGTFLAQFPRLLDRANIRHSSSLVEPLNQGAHKRLADADLSRLRRTLFDEGMLGVILGLVMRSQ